MSKRTFVHLETYSRYSFPRGVSQVGALVERARELGYTSLALTDYGSLAGLVQLFRAARQADLHAIAGAGFVLAEEPYARLLFLVENDAGYANLLALLRRTRWRDEPRLPVSALEGGAGGLFAILDLASGRMSRSLLGERLPDSIEALWRLESHFDPHHFYLGCNAALAGDAARKDGLIALVGKSGLPLVALGQVHCARPEEAMLYRVGNAVVNFRALAPEDREVLLAMPEAAETLFGRPGSPPGGREARLPHLPPPEAMTAAFSGFLSALDNTTRIAEQCRFRFPLERRRAPTLSLSRGYSPDSYLWDLVNRRAEKRYGAPDDALKHRLYTEYQWIVQHELSAPLLILHDLVHELYGAWPVLRFLDRNLTGSSIAYLLGLSNLDPIAYRIPFDETERTGDGGGVMIRAATPFGDFPRFHAHLAGRFSLERVGRSVLALAPPQKEVAAALAWLRRVYHVITEEPDEAQVRELLAETLPGGQELLISGDSLLYSLPTRPQYESEDSPLALLLPPEDLPQLNAMVLGGEPDLLASLLSRALEAIPPERRKQLFLLEDPAHFEMLRSWPWLPGSLLLGNLAVRERELLPLLWLVAPQDLWGVAYVLAMLHWAGRNRAFFAQLSAAALAAVKRGGIRQPPRWERRLLESNPLGERLLAVLQPTAGCVLFREQVVELVGVMRGGSREAALDWLREVFSGEEAFDWERLLDALEAAGCSPQARAQLAAQVTAAAPALLSRETFLSLSAGLLCLAAMRHKEPLAFACALLSRSAVTPAEKAAIIEELLDRDIPVRPPDVNRSAALAQPEDGALRLGLLDVMQVGEKICGTILAERERGPYTSLLDFCSRLDAKLVNQRVVENLVLCGAFDGFGLQRAQLLSAIDRVEEEAERPSLFETPGQLFLTRMDEEPPPPFLADLEFDELPPGAILDSEEERLGFALSTHLLRDYDEIFAEAELADLAHPERYDDCEIVALGYLGQLVDLSPVGRPLSAGIFFDGRRRFTCLANPPLLCEPLAGVHLIRALRGNLGHEPACVTRRGCLKLLNRESVAEIRARLERQPRLSLRPEGKVDWNRLEEALLRFQLMREMPVGCRLLLPDELAGQRGARRLAGLTFVPTRILLDALNGLDFVAEAFFCDAEGRPLP